MVTDAAASQGTAAVRLALDEVALTRWMKTNVGGFAGPLTVEQFNVGQSNPTYRLTTPDARYVLRRKPPGALVKGAHDVLREPRVLTTLAPTPVPIPAVLGVCEDAKCPARRPTSWHWLRVESSGTLLLPTCLSASGRPFTMP